MSAGYTLSWGGPTPPTPPRRARPAWRPHPGRGASPGSPEDGRGGPTARGSAGFCCGCRRPPVLTHAIPTACGLARVCKSVRLTDYGPDQAVFARVCVSGACASTHQAPVASAGRFSGLSALCFLSLSSPTARAWFLEVRPPHDKA